jgi:hypothetical protein
MGQSKSKERKNKKGAPKNQQQPTESSDPSDPNAPPRPVSEETSTPTDGDNTEGKTDDDESSSSGVEDGDADEAIIFSKNKQVVTKDDFELLTVIGKGSFGKVMQVRKKTTGRSTR